MNCPKCQFENTEEAKFCGECGAKLVRICPNCNSPNPPRFKFCSECGFQLKTQPATAPKELSFDEKIAKLQRYLPKGLTDKILSQRDKIEGERKQVTVMFCDMAGFTALTERLGPEEAYAVMDQIYEILIHKVHDYEGTVNEMTGDGIMALFGAPIALEDAPQRAIRSAYAIHRKMTKFSDKIRQKKQTIPPINIRMRIGIHTGPVVVGALGNDLRVEFKAVGDTVNLASRMEGIAEAGSTYVSENTYKLTEGLFRFEALGEYAVKGKLDAVKAYRVIAPSTSRTRFDVSAERGLTPFVGRDRELEMLIDGFRRSKTGSGQAFSIVSEAGTGKSRLLYEFRKAVSNEDATFQEGKCLSYSRGVAYHPVIEIVKANFDIMEGDGNFVIREKLKQGLKTLDADETSTLPYLLELLSVKDSGVDPIALSPEARKDRIIKATIRITVKASQIRPLIVAIEDLHWIDKSSEDYLKNLLDSISGAKIFLIFTYRPEFVPTWGTKSYHSQVNLNRLSSRESLAMVRYLLGTEDIDRDLQELIFLKTEGVPFFIEEFVKSLKDLEIICRKNNTYHLTKDLQTITIPSTIEDVIMAKVDSLPEGAKELLQTGSVIEREFSYPLIKQISALSEQGLLSQLSVLKDAELLIERGVYPDSTYIFKHSLTREVVYNSILARRRKTLHGLIGNAIEKLYNENIDEHYSVLAEHFVHGESYEKGAEYCRLTAREARKAASIKEAITYMNKRITCIEKLPQTDSEQKQLIDARTVLGLYYTQMVMPVEAKAAVDPIVDLAIKQNYKKRISQIYIIIGAYNHNVEENYPKALDSFQKALKIGKELNDQLAIIFSNTFMGNCLSDNGEFEKALSCFEKALEINVMVNVPWGIVALKTYIVAWVYIRQGKVELAYQTSHEALKIANETGDIFSKGLAHFILGLSCYCKGFLDEAEKNLSKAVDFLKESNLLAYAADANNFLGNSYLHRGEYETCQKYYERAIFLYQRGRLSPSYIITNRISIVLAKVKKKDKNMNLNEIFKWYEDINNRWIKGLVPNIVGMILLNVDGHHIPEAEDWIKRGIETNKKYGLMWCLAENYALYAELARRQGDLPKAREKLNQAIDIFKECGAHGWVERYEKELAALA
jgi:class 3 adenylate cyclase/tetratricopeptide (TPR) repeat protein